MRDADIGHHLIDHVETRFPLAPVALNRLSASIAVEQLRLRRKAIKALEYLELSALPEQLARARLRTARSIWDRGSWRAELRRHLSLRADEVRVAIQHAGGVYFPNRVHSARVSIKQLRYTLELADATRIWRAPRAVRALRKVQDALGDAHDRQVLMAKLDELAASSAEPIRAEVENVEHFIRAEMLALHAKYLARRPDILAICDACDRAARANGTARRALLAAGIGVPSLLLLRR